MPWSVFFRFFASVFCSKVNFQTASRRRPIRGPVGPNVRRACLSLLLPAALLLLSAGASQAQSYGDFKVVGTGADAGISFEFLATASPVTPGLQTTFSFISCTVPAGETCSTGSAQVNYSASGGEIRLVTTGTSGQSRTWNFPSMLHSDVYVGKTGAGLEPGYVVVSGADATAGQPQSNATGSAFQYPLEVTVTDTAANYQTGVTVTYTAPGSGPSAIFPGGGVVATDSNGRASIAPTANGTAGAYQITATATVGGNTFQTSFVAANVNTANATGACQVTTAADDFSAGSLRYQVAACGNGGTITFAPGITTVNLTAGQDIPLTQNLTIDGGASGVTINGNGQSRIFFVTGGAITLHNLTLENGDATGGAGGSGGSEGSGGGAAGMGGAIFVNAGSLFINNVVFSGNQAVGGDGGSALSLNSNAGGGGGIGGPGGSATAATNGNGGGGGDFGSSGGAGTGILPNDGPGDGAGGGNAGDGAFGGGGSGTGTGVYNGSGVFGGGGGGFYDLLLGGHGGIFGGNGDPRVPGGSGGGGGGGGLGGAIFMRNGTLSLTNATFISNTATGGTGQSGGSNGQGKGGALYIRSSASAMSSPAVPTFSGNSASTAGTGTACNTVEGANALDTNDICGMLGGPATHFSVSAPSPQTAFSVYTVTVTALDANGNTVAGYAGTVHLESTDPAFVNVTGDSTLTNGVGTFTVTMYQAGTQTITAIDTVDTSITGTSNPIVVQPGPVNRFTVSAPSTAILGSSFSFTVTAYDLYGNVATNYAGTMQFHSSDAAAALPPASGLTSGTGSFNATLKTLGSQTITVTDTAIGASGTSGSIATAIPSLVVTSTADSGAGSLRAALATAAADGGGNISFDATAFATPQTIASSSGTLNIPSNTSITGPAAGVTVSGGGSGSDFSVFTVASGVTNASISGLTITNGYVNTEGGGIDNEGALTVIGSSFVNNYAGGYLGSPTGNGGGAIYAGAGRLMIANSTFTGNTSAPGGAITINSGTAVISNSTFSGNSALDNKVGGAIFINTSPTVAITNSTFSGNSASGGAGGAVFNNSALTVTNSILSGNSGGDCGANGSSTCPANGTSGNVVGVSNIDLAPLANYGGATQTMIPAPGSPAICAGTNSLLPSTDQRGFARTTVYGSTTCVDAGAAQTHYALSFSTEPEPIAPAVIIVPGANFQAALTLTESGNPYTASAPSFLLQLAAGPVDATLTPGSASTSGDITTLTGLEVSKVGNYQIAATLPMNTASISATTTQFNVNQATTVLSFTPSSASQTYGTAISAATLNATASFGGSAVNGTFAYTTTVNGNLVTLVPGATVLPAGSYTIAAAFTPSDASAYTGGSITASYTVMQAASVTSLQVSSTSVAPGQSATLTATVRSATTAGTPTGTVNFYDNGTLLNSAPVAVSSGVATFVTTAFTVGTTNSLTATYSGDVNFVGSSSTSSGSTSITVAILDFTMTLAGPSNLTLMPGQSVSFKVRVAPDYGSYAGTVNFAVSGLPANASATFSPASIAANGGAQTVTVTITTLPATAALHGNHQLQSRGRRIAPFAMAFLLLFGAGSLRKRGRAVRSLMCVLVLLGAGAAATMLSGCGSHSGFFAQSPQNYTVTITATSANLQHSTDVNLNLQ